MPPPVDIHELMRARRNANGAPPGDVLPPAYTGAGPSPYGAKALAGEVARVRAAQVGTRNDTLNRAAFSLSQLVATGHIPPDLVYDALFHAAIDVGLTPTEIASTLKSGHRAGTKAPRAPTPLEPLPPVHTLLDTGERGSTGQPGTFTGTPGDPATDAAAFEAWMAANTPAIDWPTFWADDEPQEWLHPLIPARRMVALYSPPKVGKSLVVLEVAVGLAIGVPVFGATEQEPMDVLYVDFENDPTGDIKPRLLSMGYGPDDDFTRLHYLSFPRLDTLDTVAGGAQLVAVAQAHAARVVVIDTVSRAVAGKENENDTWLAFYRNTGMRLKAAGIACLRIDHTGKDEERGPRGGSAKAGDADVVWRMVKVTDDVFRLTCEANRLPVPDKVLTFRRVPLPHLHHVVEGPRWADDDPKVAELVAFMDDQQMPRDVGRRVASRVIRTTGITCSDRALQAALKVRKERVDVLEVDFQERRAGD
jgi:hypothetical protein